MNGYYKVSFNPNDLGFDGAVPDQFACSRCRIVFGSEQATEAVRSDQSVEMIVPPCPVCALPTEVSIHAVRVPWAVFERKAWPLLTGPERTEYPGRPTGGPGHGGEDGWNHKKGKG